MSGLISRACVGGDSLGCWVYPACQEVKGGVAVENELLAPGSAGLIWVRSGFGVLFLSAQDGGNRPKPKLIVSCGGESGERAWKPGS